MAQSPVAQAAAKLPKKIRVGPFTYTIKLMNEWLILDGNNTWGRFEPNAGIITIAALNETNDINQLAGTVLHECLHAVWCSRKLKDNDDEEHIVAHLELGLMALFVQNPALLRWFAQVIR